MTDHPSLRTHDLATFGHMSVQQVRNYEASGLIPQAQRSPKGYRLYTQQHLVALKTVKSLVPGYGWQRTSAIMQALHRGDLSAALATIDERHAELTSKRRQVEQTLLALRTLAAQSDALHSSHPSQRVLVGEAAKRVGVRVSALHFWEQQGLLQPVREQHSFCFWSNVLRKRGKSMIELIEKIVVDTHHKVWVAFSICGCGILAQATVGRHDEDFMETRRIALTFAHQVVHSIGLSPDNERVPTSQILIDAADAVIGTSVISDLICTTWQALPEGVKICSVGSNSVLIFEGDTIRKAFAPQNFNELLRSQGIQAHEYGNAGLVTHTLGSRNNKHSCSVDDIRVALVPLLPTTTIAVIANWRLAEDIMQRAVPRNELSSFIDTWDLLAKRVRTSVLISL